jgi:hypothetical protein
MTAANVVEGLAAARSQVERVCGLLVSASPEFLDGCPGLLERACSVIAEFKPWLSDVRGDPEALAEAYRLQFAVRHAARLLESAWQYHAKWNRILGAMTGGYTPQGDPTPVIRLGRVCLTG